ncbi:hypothetical protein [Mesorhizobium sp. M1B.F.Ca.ET.045.04.1.1]|uniref:hypothetical protein n=1 Tax=Mesorhizobium sp. M1B.F.Ca.ET.045.04.1.1 TaxID=2493673 RepID=UPI000F74C93F|nr:hypothetical protein [Mesorhizobium sp. M1B.F.Ca.ET.045.04.1.1]AZO29321.1 hypothetical protein EJ071_19335 [Mesorhizobium sp. M1B.F.Ca.ET.045.04.1.1]
MSARNDGGQAFPRTGGEVPGPNSPEWVQPQEGMSLRDWFAGQALFGLLAHGYDLTWSGHAERAYIAADAMLAERQKA